MDQKETIFPETGNGSILYVRTSFTFGSEALSCIGMDESSSNVTRLSLTTGGFPVNSSTESG